MIYCMDVVEGLQKLESDSVDCIILDPPYNIGKDYGNNKTNLEMTEYISWAKEWLTECERILKPNGTFYLNVINDSEITVRAFDLMQIATEELMYKLHDTIIWYRYNQQPANTTRQLTNQVEYIFMFRHSSAGVELDKKKAFELNKQLADLSLIHI